MGSINRPPIYLDQPEAIGRRLRILRDRAGLTSADLGADARIDSRTVRRFMAGESMVLAGRIAGLFLALGYRVRLELEPINAP